MNLEKLWADLTRDLLQALDAYRRRIAELDVREKADHTLLTAPTSRSRR